LSDKLLFFLEKGFFHFGLAQSLQKKSDFDTYAIIDDAENLKEFYKNQNPISFIF